MDEGFFGIRDFRSIDPAMEYLVLLLARGAAAAHRAADEKSDTQRDQDGRQITAQRREMRQEILHVHQAHRSNSS